MKLKLYQLIITSHWVSRYSKNDRLPNPRKVQYYGRCVSTVFYAIKFPCQHAKKNPKSFSHAVLKYSREVQTKKNPFETSINYTMLYCAFFTINLPLESRPDCKIKPESASSIQITTVRGSRRVWKLSTWKVAWKYKSVRQSNWNRSMHWNSINSQKFRIQDTADACTMGRVCRNKQRATFRRLKTCMFQTSVHPIASQQKNKAHQQLHQARRCSDIPIDSTCRSFYLWRDRDTKTKWTCNVKFKIK